MGSRSSEPVCPLSIYISPVIYISGGWELVKKCQRRQGKGKWLRSVGGREGKGREGKEEEEKENANTQNEIVDGINTLIKDGSS
jgi:hypothetical protein